MPDDGDTDVEDRCTYDRDDAKRREFMAATAIGAGVSLSGCAGIQFHELGSVETEESEPEPEPEKEKEVEVEEEDPISDYHLPAMEDRLKEQGLNVYAFSDRGSFIFYAYETEGGTKLELAEEIEKYVEEYIYQRGRGMEGKTTRTNVWYQGQVIAVWTLRDSWIDIYGRDVDSIMARVTDSIERV